MKQKISNAIKYVKPLYVIYYHVMSLFINLIKLVVKPNDKLILFNSFAGRNFDDSPKAVFDYMIRDDRFKNYELVWAFHNPESFKIQGGKKVKTDTLAYFVTALKARVWITNSSVERGLNFKGKDTLYLNTWHGTPMKKMGDDLNIKNKSFSNKGRNHFDLMTVQSNFEADVFSKVFHIPRKQFLEVGLPRNDRLAVFSLNEKERIRRMLGLPDDKKIILYAPTFREFEKDRNMGCVLALPFDINKWKQLLACDYVLLFRAHYEVVKTMGITDNEFVRNVTKYPVLNDLLIVSDILISDYSSVFFDFSIMNKCMFYFTYDYEKYSKERGLYFDIREYLSGGATEDELIHLLQNLDEEYEINRTAKFREKYIDFYGDATKKTIDCIAAKLGI